MPTGYTDKIKDGITFEEFVLICARAFGATITMRDDPPDKPIPDEFKLSDYHPKELTKARRKFTKLNKIAIKEAEKLASKEYNCEQKRIAKCIKNDRKLMAQYREMLNQARAWVAPTSEHTELKKFMIQQIESSIDQDNMEDYHIKNPAVLLTGERWLQKQKESAQWSIDYHMKQFKKGVDKAKSRTNWINNLRNSLLCDYLGTPTCNACDRRFKCFTIRNYKNVSKTK